MPQLNHRCNEIIFSSIGQRPDQNKLSGGDLDGDTYFVTWDKDLVKGFTENHPPSQQILNADLALEN